MSSDFLYLHSIIVKWLPGKSYFFYVIINMYHNMWISYFSNKTGAYSWENMKW